MPWKAFVCIWFVLILYLHMVTGFTGCTNATFERLNFTYTANDVIESVTANSHSQCALKSSNYDWCFAIEYQAESSTCVVLNTASNTAAMSTMDQYRRIYTSCHGNWTRFVDSCYFVTSDAHTWDDCKEICTGYRNSHLVTETSLAESTFVISLKQGVSIWTGGRLLTLGDPNDGMWDNGETWGYTYWSTGQPNNSWGSEYCIHYYASTTSRWGDMPCDQLHNCMCEHELF